MIMVTMMMMMVVVVMMMLMMARVYIRKVPFMINLAMVDFFIFRMMTLMCGRGCVNCAEPFKKDFLPRLCLCHKIGPLQK